MCTLKRRVGLEGDCCISHDLRAKIIEILIDNFERWINSDQLNYSARRVMLVHLIGVQYDRSFTQLAAQQDQIRDQESSD
jgi:hypothetical protein